MSIRVMLDTDVLADLDGHFAFLATYTDLIPDMPAFDALKARFPNSTVILIDRGLGDPTGQATMADVEVGAFWPIDRLPGWVERKRAEKPAGWEFLTVYSDRNDLPAIEALNLGVWHWVATLDGTAFISGWRPMHGPAAIQILGESQIGIHGDLSLILEDQWHPHTTGTGQPFPGAADVPATPTMGVGDAGDGSDLPAGKDAAPAKAWSESLEELQAKAPAWEITVDGDSLIAQLIGTRTQLSAADIISLEWRMRSLYPETVA